MEKNSCCSPRTIRRFLTLPHMMSALVNAFILLGSTYEPSFWEMFSEFVAICIQASIIFEISAFDGSRTKTHEAIFNLFLTLIHTAVTLFFVREYMYVQLLLLNMSVMVIGDLYMIGIFADTLTKQSKRYHV